MSVANQKKCSTLVSNRLLRCSIIWGTLAICLLACGIILFHVRTDRSCFSFWYGTDGFENFEIGEVEKSCDQMKMKGLILGHSLSRSAWFGVYIERRDDMSSGTIEIELSGSCLDNRRVDFLCEFINPNSTWTIMLENGGVLKSSKERIDVKEGIVHQKFRYPLPSLCRRVNCFLVFESADEKTAMSLSEFTVNVITSQ